MTAADTYTEFESESEHNRRLLGKEGLKLQITEELAKHVNSGYGCLKEILYKINNGDGLLFGDLMSKREILDALSGGDSLTIENLWVIADAMGCEVKVEVVPRKKEDRSTELKVRRLDSGQVEIQAVDATGASWIVVVSEEEWEKQTFNV